MKTEVDRRVNPWAGTRPYTSVRFAALHGAKQAIREKYAWPGGYNLLIQLKDGGVLCVDCARKNWKEIVADAFSYCGSGWTPAGVFSDNEVDDIMCDNCYCHFGMDPEKGMDG